MTVFQSYRIIFGCGEKIQDQPKLTLSLICFSTLSQEPLDQYHLIVKLIALTCDGILGSAGTSRCCVC